MSLNERLRSQREATVRRHMQAENEHDFDAVIAEFWLLGTHRGPLGGLPPSGKALRCRMTALFLFEGAGLVCERVYFDSATMLRQIAPQGAPS